MNISAIIGFVFLFVFCILTLVYGFIAYASGTLAGDVEKKAALGAAGVSAILAVMALILIMANVGHP